MFTTKKIFANIKKFVDQNKLYKQKIINFISVLWVEVKEWSKALWPDIIFYLFILSLPISMGMLLVPEIWKLISVIDMDFLHSIWNRITIGEGSKNCSLQDNINFKPVSEVVSKVDIKPEKSTTSNNNLKVAAIIGLGAGILWLILRLNT